jgi:hypothetical protein
VFFTVHILFADTERSTAGPLNLEVPAGAVD